MISFLLKFIQICSNLKFSLTKISLKTYCCFFIFLFAIHISSAQLSVFERIDKQFELSISEKNDKKRIDVSFVSIDPQQSILDDRVYMEYLYTNFRSKRS